MTTAIVFAYHNVGVRCLKVLLAHNVDVQLVVTHTDNPSETIWFDSVARVTQDHGIECITPDNPNTQCIERIAALRPEFIFSFYYRHMLDMQLLQSAQRGAYNMHGSLLPKYRGRVPINWAIIHGETQTGATLHRMVAKPDAGELIAQQAVPILPNDTAMEVFQKVTVAAEIALDSVLPSLVNGTAKHAPLDLSMGSYFGGRKPEDGRIDWQQSALQVHNLIRAVAPPYPGAFSEIHGKRLRFVNSMCVAGPAEKAAPSLFFEHDKLFAICGDGRRLALRAEHDNRPLLRESFKQLFGADRLAAC